MKYKTFFNLFLTGVFVGLLTACYFFHQPNITVTALGDNRFSTSLIKNYPKDLAQIHFNGDLVYANFEGVLYEGKSKQNLLSLNMPFSAADTLERMGVNALNLANNHVMDFGAEGYAHTYHYLKNKGFYLSGFNDHGTQMVIRGKKVRIIGFSFDSPHNVNCLNKAKHLIHSLKDDIIIVSAHMGGENSRGYLIPTGEEYFDGQKRGDVVKFSHACIDAGADLVLGHGPHVIRKVELYKNKLIVYSLGNFVFDYPGAEKNRFSPGIAIKIYLNNKGDFKKAKLMSYSLVKGVPRRDIRQRAYFFIRKLSSTTRNNRLVFQKNGIVTKGDTK